MKNMKFSLVSQNPQSTVVAEFIPTPRVSEAYQSEAGLEKEFIAQLQAQGYEYLQIHEEADLKDNLREQLQKLNHFTFSDTERERFFATDIANSNQNIEDKTATIQEDYIKTIQLEN